jgi:protein TonB
VAFEAFRARESSRSRRQRRAAFVLVAVFHGVLIAAGVVYSYWHVEELTPPTLRVTFMSAPPPPPPPPPPPGGGGARPKKIAVKPKTEPIPEKPPDIVQPPEKVKPKKFERRKYEDEYEEKADAKTAVAGKGTIGDGDDDGEEGGVKGGQKGGVIGGTIGGTGTTPTVAKIVAPAVGMTHRMNCAQPDFPASVRRAGLTYSVLAKICVSATGVVDTVTILRHATNSVLDDSVVKSERACRYRPFMFGNMPAPFCYVQPFEFRGE